MIPRFKIGDTLKFKLWTNETKTKTEMKMCSYGPLKRKEGPTSGTGSGFDGFRGPDRGLPLLQDQHPILVPCPRRQASPYSSAIRLDYANRRFLTTHRIKIRCLILGFRNQAEDINDLTHWHVDDPQ